MLLLLFLLLSLSLPLPLLLLLLQLTACYFAGFSGQPTRDACLSRRQGERARAKAKAKQTFGKQLGLGLSTLSNGGQVFSIGWQEQMRLAAAAAAVGAIFATADTKCLLSTKATSGWRFCSSQSKVKFFAVGSRRGVSLNSRREYAIATVSWKV